MNAFSRIVEFLKEARVEAKKVAWPSKKQVVRHTIVVVALSLFVAVILGAFDFIFATILERFIL
ncbi:MAG: preprotein translocase subunit SecE [Parcubacteria group bacterium Greene0714_21]|nr:MAG: preprotein translocase subunit SecE [Parcubacteria group bacterium Greene0416_39]TSC98564.1 MAG: preprotein translocase subunit SecE [Parcubacteria group bacterium Greene1014_47]TSD04325.1 MAG: preprotein translocase subunit SecE [Parcubacteria group bacterium Greene0714_21]